MSERRPHWDDELIFAVMSAAGDGGHLFIDDIHAVIAAVEDWQDRHTPSPESEGNRDDQGGEVNGEYTAPCACEWCANLDAKPCVVIERLERRIAQLERMAPKPTPLPPIDYSGMLTARMLFNAAQREADRGKDGSDLTFTRLLWIAQILAAVETAEALRVRTSGGDA